MSEVGSQRLVVRKDNLHLAFGDLNSKCEIRNAKCIYFFLIICYTLSNKLLGELYVQKILK